MVKKSVNFVEKKIKLKIFYDKTRRITQYVVEKRKKLIKKAKILKKSTKIF